MLHKFKYPILIFHGKKNQSIPHEDVFKTMEKFSSYDKTLKIIENGFIELYCDEEKDGIIVLMIDWMLKRVKKSPTLGDLSHYQLNVNQKKNKILSWRNIVLLSVYLAILK